VRRVPATIAMYLKARRVLEMRMTFRRSASPPRIDTKILRGGQVIR